MNNLKKYNTDKATVCAKNTCVTVYGEAARIITVVTVSVALIFAISYVAKALR